MVRQLWHGCLGMAMALVVPAASGVAQEPPGTAYDVVQETTERVMAVVDAAAAYADQDPERYFNELQGILDNVVDFSGFSRSVMGPYASRQRYQSLSDEGKRELRDQVERFTQVMRTGLVRTYGKGLLAFGGSRVEIQRPQDEDQEEGKATIRQLIYSDAPEPYVIEYQMRLDGDGHWKLRNLIVETINLGVIYRNQFQASAKDYGGDLNAVIDNWTASTDASEAG